MANVSTLVNRMVYWCSQVSLGYSQSDRWNIVPGGNCDCSSLVIHCLQEAGFDTGSATYTGNMSANLTTRGWTRLSPSVTKQPGDILLNDVHHVAVFIGGNKLAQASISENNTAYGVGGDQTGRETNISNYYNYPWDCVLRYTGEQDGDMTSAQDVWNYGLGSEGTADKNNQPAWVHLSWAHADTAFIRSVLCRNEDVVGDGYDGDLYTRVCYMDNRLRTLMRTDDVVGDGTTGDIYTRVCYIDQRVREMSATVAAQAAAIEAMSKAMGADPDQIAKAVEDAVKAKLDSLDIKITAE